MDKKRNQTIVLFARVIPLLMWMLVAGSAYAQKKVEVTGIVTSVSNNPLPGVTVQLKSNGSTGTITDINGRFVLELPDSSVLVFSLVGYKTQELAAEEKLKVVLEEAYPIWMKWWWLRMARRKSRRW
ncbi:carboxypeptidase-like regulatory domain-containing protein [Niabella aurantiaca]|uniref:carboxypeptidase-like regulatory domain-containing protein n=1 Tax=Niabella aurantiaca TaxID=379900 RepID=UPI0003A89B81|nr:carboxypeptidase-like regulatory domain-containing protein [Niabella aurantiaca]